MNIARSSGESLSGIGKPKYGSEPQLTNVVLISVVLSVMFSVFRVFRLLVLLREILKKPSCGQFDRQFVCFNEIPFTIDYFFEYNLHMYGKC